ncbi:MAG: hypothetical protein ACRDNS_16300 [Trebonia sp.]
MRRLWLVGFFTLVLLALATHVTAARAVTPSNTITQTAITSPTDPSYYYDPTGGAYGSITVTGTTNSTDPANDTVDIDCYSDDGDSSSDEYTVAPDVTLNADGGFSTTVPYSALEEGYVAYDPDGSMCRLRAVPASTSPSSGLGSFAGPRVLLAYLGVEYDNNTYENLDDYQLDAPQLGATNVYSSASDCGLAGSFLNDQSIFGQADGESFACTDVDGAYELPLDQLQVGGADAYMPYSTDYEPGSDPADQLTVSVAQDADNGDIAVTETDPVYVCSDANCDSYTSSGVEQDRTIRQTASGQVVEITDSFRSTDGNAHKVNLELSGQMCFETTSCDYDNYNPSVTYEFPGESSFSTHANGDVETVGSQSPASIYIAGGNVNGAITYFTPPSGPFSFDVQQYNFGNGYIDTYENALIAPYDFTVPAGGSVQLTYAYSTDISQDALPADIATATTLQSTPAITITSPVPGATTSSPTVTVIGTAIAATAIDSVTVNGVSATLDGSSYSATVPLSAGSNTVTAVVTVAGGDTASTSEAVTYSPLPSSSNSFTLPLPSSSNSVTPPLPSSSNSVTPPLTISPAQAGHWAGPTWLPIADTGTARHAGRLGERLSGRVTSGSGGVTYYFQYGARGHLTHHTKMVALAASQASQQAVLTVGGLSRGTKYSYRLVATGTYGHATGRKRSFKTTNRKK